MALQILIADDSSLMRQALRRTLDSLGSWEIIDANNGEEALAKARETKPNLIILDLAMPVMDGLRAARAITQVLPDVPIILHTLHWTPRVVVEALKSGIRKVVPKSDSASIVTAVRELMPLTPANQTSDVPTSEVNRTVTASDPARHSPPDGNDPASQ